MLRTRRLLLRIAVAPAVIACVIAHASAQQVILSPTVAGAGAASMSRGGIVLAATGGQAMIGLTMPGGTVGQWGFWHAMRPSGPVGVVERTRIVDAGVSVRLAPNPATDRARLDLALARSGNVRVRLLDLMGNVVAHVAEGRFESGERSLEIPLVGLPSASYIVELLHNGARTSFVLVVMQ